jgi:hypothetical protein
MPAVNPVELPPLLRRERTQNGMIQKLRGGAEPIFAFVKLRCHCAYFTEDRLSNICHFHSGWKGAFGSFPARGKVARCQEQEGRNALSNRGPRCQRSSLFQAFCQPLGCILVCKKKVLEDLGTAPLSLGAGRKSLCTRSEQSRIQFVLQAIKMRSHGVCSFTMSAKIKQRKSYRTH